MDQQIADSGTDTDLELLRQIQAGRLEGFDEFVGRYDRILFRWLMHWVGDWHQAEDLLQEVFLRVLRSGDTGALRGRASVKTWLFTVARNCVIDVQRKAGRRVGRIEVAERSPADPVQDAIHAEAVTRTHAVLEQLPLPQREVLSLRIFGDLTLSEIAEATDTPLPTVKSRLRYALEKAKGILEPRAEVLP